MNGVEIITRGFKETEKKLAKREAEIAANEHRAEKAAANYLKTVMRAEAPYETKRDVARNRARVRHLRATIRVRRQVNGHYAVGPASPLAHLVVRGAARGQVELVGGGGGEAHQMTLAGRRQLRMHARHLVGPAGAAQALMISSGGEVFFRASARPGPMPANNFIARTREIGYPEAKTIAGAVALRNAPDLNEGA